jgi:type II secretory ATPase GspE/PulE/Tfp pilus assembly ATPase PilB-like protein
MAASLRGVMAQRLVSRICDNCKNDHDPSPELIASICLPKAYLGSFYKGSGCSKCSYTGFNGKLPICEIWIPTREELQLIATHPDNILLRKDVFSVGKRASMLDDGLLRVANGETSLEELARVLYTK